LAFYIFRQDFLMLFAWITDPNAWMALGTLTILEIVLGIDNIIFLSLVVAKLPKAQQAQARRLGLGAAMIMRLVLLASIAWMTHLFHPLFSVMGHEFSARDLILTLGGVFLIWKASKEIHESIEGEEEGIKTNVHSFFGAIVQIMLLDIIFSLDSVITAVGLSDHLFIMMAAVVIAVMATKDGRMILTDGKPKVDDDTGLVSYRDQQGNEMQINRDDVSQIIER